MKAIFRVFTVFMAVALMGCGSSNTPPQIGLLYLVGAGANVVQGFSQKADGEITSLTVSNFNTNPRPVSMVLTPDKKFLYVTNLTSNTVSGYTVNHTNGVLTPVGEALAPSPVGILPINVGIDSTGHFLYVLNQGNGTAGTSTISVFSIDTVRGILTPIAGSPFAVPANPQYMLVSPTAAVLYVVAGSPSAITAFAIAPNGAVASTSTGTFTGPANANITSITVDPKAQFMYATDFGNGNVISLNLGTLAPVAGSPFTAGTGPNGVAVDSSGTLVYVSNKGSNDVSAFLSTAGVLAPITGSPFTTIGTGTVAPTAPGFLTVDSSNKFLYVANTATNGVAAFQINPDGTLATVLNSPFGQVVSPTWIVTSP
jgi:6-phosphogluconolactonase